MQVIGHQHQIEAAAGQGPGAAVLEIGSDLGQAGRIGLLVGIAVQRRDGQAMRQQQPAMPSGPGRQIEGRAAGGGQRQEAENPGRGCLRRRQVWAIYEDGLITR